MAAVAGLAADAEDENAEQKALLAEKHAQMVEDLQTQIRNEQLAFEQYARAREGWGRRARARTASDARSRARRLALPLSCTYA
jgi:hypothetical protein